MVHEPFWFTQQARVGGVEFTVSYGSVKATGKRGPVRIAVDVPLKNLNPAFRRGRVSSFPFVATHTVVALTCVIASVGLFWMRWWAILMCAPFSVGLAATCAIRAVRYTAPLDVVTFSTIDGKPSFDVFREKGQAREFDAFIEQLCAAIRAARGLQ